MSCPSHEEWMGYLYGELDGESCSRLRTHLHDCGECRENVAAWRGAISALETWQLPRGRGRSALRSPLVRWAVAAMVLLAIGYGLGRLLAPRGPDEGALRASLLASLAPSLEAQVRQTLREEFAADWRSALEETRAQFRRDAEDLGAQTLAASNVATQRLLTNVVRILDDRRAAQQQALVAALDELELRRRAGDEALRSDLDDLAVLTGDEILRTRRDIGWFLVQSGPVRPAADGSSKQEAPQERRGE